MVIIELVKVLGVTEAEAWAFGAWSSTSAGDRVSRHCLWSLRDQIECSGEAGGIANGFTPSHLNPRTIHIALMWSALDMATAT